jgi:hypothetical protein
MSFEQLIGNFRSKVIAYYHHVDGVGTQRLFIEEFTATIEYKVWGKYTNLLLYVVTDDGQRCLLSIFRNRSNEKYTPRNLPDFDLSNVGVTHIRKLRF